MGQLGYEVIHEPSYVQSKNNRINPRMEAFLDTATYEIYEAHEFDLEGIVFTNKDYINAKIDKRIMELWKEYQVECWNDSTFSHYIVYDPFGNWWFNSSRLSDEDRTYASKVVVVYQHKHTNDLSDFMLFIERKTTSK
jgi:hypothetical protein